MTEYKRYQGKSYMVISDDKAAHGYEYAMLTKNKMKGLLPVKISNADAYTQYWYDISGRQTLEDRMKIRKGGSGLLKKLMAALAETLDEASEFLLCEDGICLSAEQIFIDAKETQVLFCYRPFQKEPFAEALGSFMEYFISHMQHDNRTDTQKCYAVYEKCQQKNITIDELLQILFEEEKEEYFEKEEEPEMKPVKHEAKEKYHLQRPQYRKLLACLPGRPDWSRNRTLFGKKSVSDESYAFEPEECPTEQSNPTVLLGSEVKEIIGEFRYEGEAEQSNLKVTSAMFLVGSQRDEADGIILDDTVSRIHARITREGDGYYLEDMNSTNGTYRNGEALNYKEKVKLEKNDRISFAKQQYRFV